MHGIDFILIFIDNMLWCVPLSILFLIVNWLDFYLTKRGLSKGGVELNPVIKFIGLLPTKIATSILIIGIGFYINKWILVASLPPLIFVGIWNFIQFRKK